MVFVDMLDKLGYRTTFSLSERQILICRGDNKAIGMTGSAPNAFPFRGRWPAKRVG